MTDISAPGSLRRQLRSSAVKRFGEETTPYSVGFSDEAQFVSELFARAPSPAARFLGRVITPGVQLDPNDKVVRRVLRKSRPVVGRPIERPEQHFDHLALLYLRLREVSMHFDQERLRTLFEDLEFLLEWDTWPEADPLPAPESFSSYLRFLVFLKPRELPHLGVANSGNFLAAWASTRKHLFFEYASNSEISWSFVETNDKGKALNVLSGRNALADLPRYIAPIEPKQWFEHG